jgi:hypothetical protein
VGWPAEHYPVVVDKLARMHAREPTLAHSDLNAVTNRALVMVGETTDPVANDGADPSGERCPSR